MTEDFFLIAKLSTVLKKSFGERILCVIAKSNVFCKREITCEDLSFIQSKRDA